MRRRFGCCRCRVATRFALVSLAASLPAAGWLPVSAAPPAGAERELDEAAFREGLRQRGLTDWLDQHLADVPPISPADAQLRERERLLDAAAAPGLTRQVRREKVDAAGAILSRLITEYPQHPARLTWLIELARDRLERSDPAAFDAILLYELPGEDRTIAARLAGEAVQTLRQARDEVGAAWKVFGAMDEAALAAATESGATRALEGLDGQSAYLLAWAEFYEALAADMPAEQRSARLAGLVERVARQYGWTALSPGREAQRCGALAMATIGARLSGQYIEAERYAREIIETIQAVREPGARQALRTVALVAVLEQIRIPRDAGKPSDATAMLQEARTWAERARAGDMQTELSLALAERHLMAARAGAGGGLLAPAEALLPLHKVASRSPAVRDALYETLAGVVGSESLDGKHSGLELQLVAGAMLAHAAARATASQPAAGRLAEVITAVNGALIASPAGLSQDTRGELLYLLARGQYLGGATLEAVRVLCDLVEQHPAHDRAPAAVQQAVAIAQDLLRRPDRPDLPSVRAAFIRAGRLLRQRMPESPGAKQLQFFIAAALDENRLYEEAAAEYGRVDPNDPRALRAAWGQARCLRDALNLAGPASRPTEGLSALAEKALVAARAAESLARGQTGADACLSADITLVLADLLNSPTVARPEAALDALQGFEQHHAACPASIGPALRERVNALRQLKRMAEARAVVEQYLAAEPDAAGPVLARLLDAMREEIIAAEERGDTAAGRATAAEATRLAERLLEWAGKHPGKLNLADTLTTRIWRAWALLEAGRAADALPLYEEAHKAVAEALPAESPLHVEIQLGRAECLLGLKKPQEALPAFMEVWTRAAQQSQPWWRAYVGTLRAHLQLNSDPVQVRQSIRQQRNLYPDLGGPRWKRALEAIEAAAGSTSSAPTGP